MLTVTNVKKQFDGTEVLKGVSLSVNKGDVIAIIGQSGGGKTTYMVGIIMSLIAQGKKVLVLENEIMKNT